MLIIQIALAIVLAYIIIISWQIWIALIAGIILIIIVSKIINILFGKHLGPSQKEECDEKWRIWEEQREKEKTQKLQEEQEKLARKENLRKAKEQRRKWFTKQKFQDNMKNKVKRVGGGIVGDPSEAMQSFFRHEDELNKNNKTEI